jgi:CRISPR-associated exonuclease Cas4
MTVPTSTWLIDLLLAMSAATSLGAAVLLWHKGRSDLGTSWSSRSGRVIASDTRAAPPQTLHDPANGLRGRPDYLLEQQFGRAVHIVPLELKPQRHSRRLYESDAVQLGVYLLAARATYGARAALFGYVRYAREEFRVELTPSLEQRVLQIATAIRAERKTRIVHRSHAIPARCAGCAVRRHCDESLV